MMHLKNGDLRARSGQWRCMLQITPLDTGCIFGLLLFAGAYCGSVFWRLNDSFGSPIIRRSGCAVCFLQYCVTCM